MISLLYTFACPGGVAGGTAGTGQGVGGGAGAGGLPGKRKRTISLEKKTSSVGW